jgi:hypothetical protein
MSIDKNRDFKIVEAILSTDRNDASIDISGVITDFEIYEHLDKPYLTASFIVLDQYKMVELLDMQGIEKLFLKIESPHTKHITTKMFRIAKLKKTIKSNDRSEILMLEAIEEHAYISNAININKCYAGTPTSIISSIASEYLDKDISTSDQTFQGNMKVIVPNLNPIKAIKWIQQRATNPDGMPYYVYSTLGDDDLKFYHLGTLLRQNRINQDHTYVYSPAAAQNSNDKQYFVIESYSHDNTENMFKLIQDGFVGAQYNFYDVSNGFAQEVDFNVKIDAFDTLVSRDYLPKEQSRYSFPPNSKINDTLLAEQKAKTISKISSSEIYKGAGNFKSYAEEIDDAAYRKNIIGTALKHFMTKSPITINVTGKPYIMGGNKNDSNNLTIGNIVRLKFFDSNVNVDTKKPKIDTKKSGDYVIYAAKHMFKLERYDVQLLCAKVSSYNKDGTEL